MVLTSQIRGPLQHALCRRKSGSKILYPWKSLHSEVDTDPVLCVLRYRARLDLVFKVTV